MALSNRITQLGQGVISDVVALRALPQMTGQSDTNLLLLLCLVELRSISYKLMGQLPDWGG